MCIKLRLGIRFGHVERLSSSRLTDATPRASASPAKCWERANFTVREQLVIIVAGGNESSRSALVAELIEKLRLLQPQWDDCAEPALDGRRLRPDAFSVLHFALRLSAMNYPELETLILDDYRVNRRRSLRSLESARLPHLRAFFNARKIDAATLRAYIAQRIAAGAANATINRELAALRRMHTLASLPYPRVTQLREAPPREGFVTPPIFDRIRAELPPHLRDFVAFLYFSSWRVGEARSLTWSCVSFADPPIFRLSNPAESASARFPLLTQGAGPCPAARREGDYISLPASHSKNNRARILPLRGELRAILLRALAARSPHTDLVFHHGRCAAPLADFRRAWHSATTRAGAPGLLLHDLRRSAIRNFVRAGVRESVAMALSGHRTRSVFDRYNITDNADLISAVEAVSNANDPRSAQ